MKNLLVILISSVIIICSSCVKDISPKVLIEKEVKVSSSLKEWALFKAGTYWIYRDSISNNIDSIYVTSVVTSSIKQVVGDTSYIKEHITVNFNAQLYSFIMIAPESYILSNLHYETIFDEDTSKWSGTIKQNNSVSTLSILPNIYSNLRYVYFAYQFASQSPFAWVIEKNYWKKNIGILKRRTYSTTNLLNSYEVIRYNIVQ